MKLVNLETGKSCQIVKSDKGFKVVYLHDIGIETFKTMRAIQSIDDTGYVIWSDYTISFAAGIMYISIETGEKIIVLRD